jgi:hypothetical protein
MYTIIIFCILFSFLIQILQEIRENDIGIYEFPDLVGEEDNEQDSTNMRVRNKYYNYHITP